MTAGKYTPVPVIFLDRDGVINKPAAPHEYITSGPSMNILINLMTIVSLTFAPLFILVQTVL